MPLGGVARLPAGRREAWDCVVTSVRGPLRRRTREPRRLKHPSTKFSCLHCTNWLQNKTVQGPRVDTFPIRENCAREAINGKCEASSRLKRD
jgi:hypothetical protein